MGVWHEAVSQYGYIAIFTLLTMGLLGLPVPDEVLVTYLGYITSLGEMSFTITFLSAVFGSICGISISYFIGVKLGEPFVRKYGSKLKVRAHTIERTKRLFSKYGSIFLIISYFIPGVRHVAAYISGITKYSFKHFLFFATIGAVVWVTVFLSLGNRLGANWGIIADFIRKYSWSIVGTLILIIVVCITYYRYRKQHT
ncbi:DedA family protein [Cerasibacillus terrae]|nr:DedA family protein [Cerasibacillus terrae]